MELNNITKGEIAMIEHQGLISINWPSIIMLIIDIIIVVAIIVFVYRFVSRTTKSIKDLEKRVENLEANKKQD